MGELKQNYLEIIMLARKTPSAIFITRL